MANQKYIVLRTKEIREVLSPEEQKQLLGIIDKMTAARLQANKGISCFFTLNMEDKFALAAVEAYLQAIKDDEHASNQIGVQEASRAAWAARQYAIMNFDGDKLPG